ncbi:hypothetical protein K435DRAFT_78821 [Dendrothele bispora CBS 962.96]|uniref:Uncharacterized protein n=1 Tax=Dendrothele bispora (strain CBS 962.96) TaxID=1314807 RepID=A0A4S8M453_DENBC|nr:hypothetical protein K435DRAFT_78821 [Dendrothele bispora CBS 962.96]
MRQCSLGPGPWDIFFLAPSSRPFNTSLRDYLPTPYFIANYTVLVTVVLLFSYFCSVKVKWKNGLTQVLFIYYLTSRKKVLDRHVVVCYL